jgi:hypothetical protein
MLIADFVARRNVPFHVMESTEFRELQKFYTMSSSDDFLGRSDILITYRKLANVIMPRRYEVSIQGLKEKLKMSKLSKQATYADDGWTGRMKRHYTGVTVGSPGVPLLTVDVLSSTPESLHAVSIAAEWEAVVLESSARGIESNVRVLKEFIIPINSTPVAFVSDSASPNKRARSIAAARHPEIIFIPCFAHVAALECGDIITKRLSAKCVGDAIHIVAFSTHPQASGCHGSGMQWKRFTVRVSTLRSYNALLLAGQAHGCHV